MKGNRGADGVIGRRIGRIEEKELCRIKADFRKYGGEWIPSLAATKSTSTSNKQKQAGVVGRDLPVPSTKGESRQVRIRTQVISDSSLALAMALRLQLHSPHWRSPRTCRGVGMTMDRGRRAAGSRKESQGAARSWHLEEEVIKGQIIMLERRAMARARNKANQEANPREAASTNTQGRRWRRRRIVRLAVAFRSLRSRLRQWRGDRRRQEEAGGRKDRGCGPPTAQGWWRAGPGGRPLKPTAEPANLRCEEKHGRPAPKGNEKSDLINDDSSDLALSRARLWWRGIVQSMRLDSRCLPK